MKYPKADFLISVLLYIFLVLIAIFFSVESRENLYEFDYKYDILSVKNCKLYVEKNSYN